MVIKVNALKIEKNTSKEQVLNDIKEKPEIDLKLAEQTTDAQNQEQPDLDLDMDLTKLDIGMTITNFENSKSAYNSEVTGFKTDRENGFSKPEKFKNNAIKLNYTRDVSANINEVSTEGDYVNKNAGFQSSAAFQVKQTENMSGNSPSFSFGLKADAMKDFNFLDGKGEFDGKVVVSDTDNSNVLLNGKAAASYEHKITEFNDVVINGGTRLSAEGTLKNMEPSAAKVSFDTAVNIEKKTGFISSVGVGLNVGVSDNLVTNDLINAGLITKIGMETYKKIELDDVAYLKASGKFDAAGNSSYLNMNYTIKGELRTPLSLTKERYLGLNTEFSRNFIRTKVKESDTENWTFGAIFENDNGNDIYAKYNYNVTDNKHSATLGARIKM